MAGLVAAVDVGTGSARAGLFRGDGRMLGRAERPIALCEPGPDMAEQDSDDIWAAVCGALRDARAEAGARPEQVRGLGFDATASLVLLDAAGLPLAASGGAARWNTLLWLDHRARAEADEATATGHAALADLGGVMSPEMQIPKLMWMKRRRPATWARLGRALDLADYLTWRATGSSARARCTLASKWSYGGRNGPGWRTDFLVALGLDDLAARALLPDAAAATGADLGPLAPSAAAQLGLGRETRVAAGLIDAHAGALGVLGGLPGPSLDRGAALIAGTSNCLMTLSRRPVAGFGLWGPAEGVVLPGRWMTEAGQSTAGALLDQISRLGGRRPEPALHRRIGARIAELRAVDGWDLAGELHVLADMRGNRSPHADHAARGAISGLGLDASFDGLCKLYWRAAVGVALGLAEAVGALRAAGAPVARIEATGGHARSPLLMELYATATGVTIEAHGGHRGDEEGADGVLLGAAMAAASAAGLHPGVAAAAKAMRGSGREIPPDPAGRARLARDAQAQAAMRRHRAELAALGDASAPDCSPPS